MAESKVFKLSDDLSVEIIAEHIEAYLKMEKGMITQSSPTADGFIIQATSEQNGWKTISGMKLAISMQLTVTGDTLVVQTGEGQWADKVGAGAIAWFVAWPLAITAGIGISKQKKLPSEILNEIEKYILSGEKSVILGAPVTASEGISCPKCGKSATEGSEFCSKCGTKILNTIECPKCGAQIPPDSEFCIKCGVKISQTLTCSKCGAELPAGSAFCNKCGQAQ